MAKKTNFFSHDSNARNDEKLIRLRMKHGAEGYGVYFMILERLREESEYMSAKDYNVIAFDLRVDASIVKSVVEDFGLFAFTDDGKCFYSESFLERMTLKDDLQKKRSDAGKKGNEVRWETNRKLIANQSQCDSDAIVSERERKEPKEIEESKQSKESKENKDIYIAQLLENEGWKEVILMRHKITEQDFAEKIRLFELDCQCSGVRHMNLKDTQSHFNSWLRIQIQTEKQNKNGKDKSDNRRASKKVTAKPEDYKTTF